MSRLNLNIGSAHVVTFGEKAVDVFYVTDLTGLKITASNRQASIRKALIEALVGTAAADASKAQASKGSKASATR